MPFLRLFYHFVWGARNREPLIAPEWQDSLHAVIAAKASDLCGIVHAVRGTEDHIHLIVSVPPKLALSVFIGQVKGNSSHFVNHELGSATHCEARALDPAMVGDPLRTRRQTWTQQH